jgi:hypothetical protein
MAASTDKSTTIPFVARVRQSHRNRLELQRLEALADRLDPAVRTWLLVRIEERRMQWATARQRAAARRAPTS